MNHEVIHLLTDKTSLSVLSKQDRSVLRSDIYLVSETIGKMDKKHLFSR